MIHSFSTYKAAKEEFDAQKGAPVLHLNREQMIYYVYRLPFINDYERKVMWLKVLD